MNELFFNHKLMLRHGRSALGSSKRSKRALLGGEDAVCWFEPVVVDKKGGRLRAGDEIYIASLAGSIAHCTLTADVEGQCRWQPMRDQGQIFIVQALRRRRPLDEGAELKASDALYFQIKEGQGHLAIAAEGGDAIICAPDSARWRAKPMRMDGKKSRSGSGGYSLWPFRGGVKKRFVYHY